MGNIQTKILKNCSGNEMPFRLRRHLIVFLGTMKVLKSQLTHIRLLYSMVSKIFTLKTGLMD